MAKHAPAITPPSIGKPMGGVTGGGWHTSSLSGAYKTY
ncbi:hypothetical protein JCM19274_897 [Algibacter lectus]|uniref:Uncharacterized protein n=1 Tax=Algibacter lectus TaxID=221126 RepID=A0A090WQF7_9FLAO|nr:hypothetical protein JCM19274_897 [Algibacter lectus]